VPEFSTPEVDVEEDLREPFSTENQLFDLDTHVEPSVI
jgi:hypothetical protein